MIANDDFNSKVEIPNTATKDDFYKVAGDQTTKQPTIRKEKFTRVLRGFDGPVECPWA